MSLASLCNQTATIKRTNYGTDDFGGVTISYSAVYTDVPVSVQPASGRTIEEFARRGTQITNTVYTPKAVAIKSEDTVEVGSAIYLVQWFEDQAGRGRVYAIHCKQKE